MEPAAGFPLHQAHLGRRRLRRETDHLGQTRVKLTLQIVKRPDDLHTFKVLPRRWVVERTLSWITRHRRTVRDYERLPAHHETYVYWSMIIVMTRRLARQRATAQPQAA